MISIGEWLGAWTGRDDKKTLDQDIVLLIQRWIDKGETREVIVNALIVNAEQLANPKMRPSQGA